MPYIALIGAVIQGGIALYGASQTPNYPSYPKMKPLDVQHAKDQAEAYGQKQYDQLYNGPESQKMRFPKLWAAKMQDIDSNLSKLKGGVDPLVQRTQAAAGLAQVPEGGNVYKTAQQMGLDPVQTQQRDMMRMSSLIAANPEVSTKLSGADLATLIANKNHQANQAAVGSFGAQVAGYNASQAQSANSFAMASVAATGMANAGANFANNQAMSNSMYNPNPFNTGYYQQGVTYGSTPAYNDPYKGTIG